MPTFPQRCLNTACKVTAVLLPRAWDLCFWPSLEIISFLFPNCVHPMEPDTTAESFPFWRRITPRLLHSIAGILICHKTVSNFPNCAQFSLIKTSSSFPHTKYNWFPFLLWIYRIITVQDGSLHLSLLTFIVFNWAIHPVCLYHFGCFKLSSDRI